MKLTLFKSITNLKIHTWLLFLLHIKLAASEAVFPWVVFYGGKEEIASFEPYNPILLDSKTVVDVNALRTLNKEVLGYVNLGEVEDFHPWFSELKQQGLLINENPTWVGSWSVDIRKPQWEKFVIEKIIPEMLEKGFTGIFCDQLDVSITLEQQDPKTYAGMGSAAVELVKSIRSHFPHKKLMVSRAYELLEQIGNEIDYLLADALYTDFDFKTHSYYIISKKEYQRQMDYLNRGRKQFPHLVIFSLDYWDPKEQEMYKTIYTQERSNCLRPYVSSLALDKIIPEPDQK